jgi:hypothetical protein
MLRKTKAKDGKTRVTFSLPITEPAGPVSVVGDFNDWAPGQHELVRRGTAKSRSVTVELAQGSHLFRYLATGGIWFDDPAADRFSEAGSVIEV